jgi:hypothetical protein
VPVREQHHRVGAVEHRRRRKHEGNHPEYAAQRLEQRLGNGQRLRVPGAAVLLERLKVDAVLAHEPPAAEVAGHGDQRGIQMANANVEGLRCVALIGW